MSQIIDLLNDAKKLAFSNRDTFPQVLRSVLKLSNNPDVNIQKWCAEFFKDSFTSTDKQLGPGAKIDLALDALDSLILLVEVKNSEIFKNCIDTSIVVYKMVFRYVSENDGCTAVWQKLNLLKTAIISKYSTSFPLESDDFETTVKKSLDCKIEILKFIIVVIDYGSRTTSKPSPPRGYYCLNNVPSNHSLIKPSQMESESFAYLEELLKIFEYDILITPLITGTLNHFAVIAKRKPQFLPKILQTLQDFDTQTKNQSNYESLEEFKLSRKYVDRSLKIFFNYCLRQQLTSPQFQLLLGKKLSMLVNRGDDVRKRNILSSSKADMNIKKRKFDGFVNSSIKLENIDYKNLYCLTEPSNELNNFDITTLPQNILVSMALTALNRVGVEKLTKALNIIVDRYKHAVETAPPAVEESVKRQKVKTEDSEDEEDGDGNYDTETVYSLPPPKAISFEEKKAHVNIIIKNFFKLSERTVTEIEEIRQQYLDDDGSGVDKELTKIAIQSWKKDSWLVLLTRLATRGMRGVDTGDDPKPESSDVRKNEDISNMIRKALFDHFLDNIHTRIDLIIEWLSEEWYSEKVYNEEKLIKDLTNKYVESGESGDISQRVQTEVSETSIPTPNYNSWAGKVLDAMIPFLEPNDRKIFIRLLSDLPYLNAELVERIKSLCYDPVRSKIGFLSLQFLIMYRPPVKQACIGILQDLSKSDQEDLAEESLKLLKRYE